MDLSQEYNVNCLITSNSILCNTIGKLEKRVSEAENRIAMLNNVIADKDRQLDVLYHKMNELYNILRQKEDQIENLIAGNKHTIPVIKVSASNLVPLVKVPAPCRPSTSKTTTPEQQLRDSISADDLKNDEVKSEDGYENYTDKYKTPTICVTRSGSIIKAVTAQTIYVETLKKKSEINLDNIVVEINCKQPQKLWDETMKVCHHKYRNKVKLLRKSLCFNSVRDAKIFSDEIAHLYRNLNLWDCNKQYVLDQ
ncbi:Bro-A [Mocis latipes granulovirus]|uniref:Bro-A n=1 Tax=Mocis latipes granulovirus TaxID=2072024 RepID=A0A162GVM8_9BBAC|nr:Bro-A [Mocis latipes granulovirus]AKR17430.1 Bro-A [Mocis latipes granulovirus]